MENVKAIECRFATYVKSNKSEDDIHVIKEQVHLEDGTIVPRLKYVKNYKRDFFITKKAFRNHKSKKEWVNIDQVDKFTTTQTHLVSSIAKALGTHWFQGSLRDINKSPFVYGSDISSTCLIKKHYRQKWDIITPFSVAVFDTETDEINGTKEIIMATISFKEKVFTCIKKSFLKGYTDVENRIQNLLQKYLSDVVDKRNIKLELSIVDTEIDIVKQTISKAHLWSPDFLAVWNIEFDMDKIIAACDRAKVDIKDIMSDPSVPEEYKSFKFKKGASKKITASNVTQSFKPAQRWHSISTPSSFYWIDAMCAYKHIRTGSPDEQSYSLDNILNKHLKRGKLKFEEADHLNKTQWHQFMQSKYPLEYVIYNIFDCVSIEMLDETTLDLQLSLPMFSGYSDFANFNSQPRRAVNDLHFFSLSNNKIIGSTSSDLTEEFDKLTTSLGKGEDGSGWIVMLPSQNVTDSGLKIIEENDKLSTNIRAHCGDLDATASYPTGMVVFNVSKETTSKELVSINNKSVNTHKVKMQIINFSGCTTNALEFCTEMFNLPHPEKWLEDFNQNELV